MQKILNLTLQIAKTHVFEINVVNPEEENQRQLDARKLPKQGMDIELAEENFIMILAEHKINDLMQVRQILGRGKRVKGISNGAYFTVEFGRRKTEDLEVAEQGGRTITH